MQKTRRDRKTICSNRYGTARNGQVARGGRISVEWKRCRVVKWVKNIRFWTAGEVQRI